MGWKTSCIFILPEKQVAIDEVKTTLGISSLTPCEPEPLEIAIYPKDKCFIGYIDGRLFISHPELIYEVIMGDERLIEKLTALFPNSKILLLSLLSTVNHYAFILYENGQLVRRKIGNDDEPVQENIGDLLPSEKAFIDQYIDRIEKGEYGNEYFYKDDVKEGYAEDAVGEELVSHALKEVWDYELFAIDEKYFFETKLEGFLLAEKERIPKPVYKHKINWKRHILTAFILLLAIWVHRLLGC